MYNQYLDDRDLILLDSEPQGPNRPGRNRSGPQHPNHQNRPGQTYPAQGPGHPPAPAFHRPQETGQSKNDLLTEVTGGLGQLLDGVLKHFSLKNFDTGDILLVLIILFLYLESGDNLELVITLGLLLLLGLGDDKPGEGDAPPDDGQ